MRFKQFRSALAGAAAGAVNGLFGAGGGMVLVPILSGAPEVTKASLFPSSLAIILPICLTSLLVSAGGDLPWSEAWPFLLGGVPGGLVAVSASKRIPVKWLHRALGVLILYGGVRYLW